MKILLDENLPKKLKFGFDARHQVFSVRDLERVGKKNGELQNLKRFPIRGFVLNAKNSKIQTLSLFLPKLNHCINDLSAEQVVIVNI